MDPEIVWVSAAALVPGAHPATPMTPPIASAAKIGFDMPISAQLLYMWTSRELRFPEPAQSAVAIDLVGLTARALWGVFSDDDEFGRCPSGVKDEEDR
jgi:hypothetical protein